MKTEYKMVGGTGQTQYKMKKRPKLQNVFLWVRVKPSLSKHWQSEKDIHMQTFPFKLFSLRETYRRYPDQTPEPMTLTI